MKTYLKSTEYPKFEVFDQENLIRCEVFRGEEMKIERFDDLEDFFWNINYSLKKMDMEITTKEEYNSELKKFQDNYKETMKILKD